jgi:hypothetical protein
VVVNLVVVNLVVVNLVVVTLAGETLVMTPKPPNQALKLLCKKSIWR